MRSSGRVPRSWHAPTDQDLSPIWLSVESSSFFWLLTDCLNWALSFCLSLRSKSSVTEVMSAFTIGFMPGAFSDSMWTLPSTVAIILASSRLMLTPALITGVG